jgi:hypothetical protein
MQGVTLVKFMEVAALYMYIYESWLTSNAHSEISRKRNHVFKQMKRGTKVQ